MYIEKDMPLEIGVTTFEDIEKRYPEAAAKSIATSYGYETVLPLSDGRKALVRFMYVNGEFVANSIQYLDD